MPLIFYFFNMKNTILAILALVQLIVGMLFVASASSSGVFAQDNKKPETLAIKDIDNHKASEWYGPNDPTAIVATTDVEIAPPPALTFTPINRQSH